LKKNKINYIIVAIIVTLYELICVILKIFNKDVHMSLATTLASSAALAVPTMIGVLVDKSGSMSCHTKAVTDGVTQLVAEQLKLKGAGRFTLAEFSGDYNVVLDNEFTKLSPKFHYNYNPNGGTCLYDSLYKMTTDFEQKIKEMSKKPKKVVITVITDGEDSGCKVSIDTIKDLIKNKIKDGWEYLLLGADSSTLEMASNMGISKDRAAIFNNNIAGSIDFIARKIGEVRRGKTLAITADERATLALPSGKKEL
jgi:hypothetical protein